MNNIINTTNYNGVLRRWLDALGITDTTGLASDEKATYNQWYDTLTGELTIEKLATFIMAQIKEQQRILQDAVKAGKDRVALQAVAQLENYQALNDYINEPERTKAALAHHIEQLISQHSAGS